ncbi:MAG: hypothetical protein AB7E70_03725 [Hyphomicrobiaceae bacterium]
MLIAQGVPREDVARAKAAAVKMAEAADAVLLELEHPADPFGSLHPRPASGGTEKQP